MKTIKFIFSVLGIIISLVLASCNNETPELPAVGPGGIGDHNWGGGGFPVTEIPSEGYELTIHKGDYHVSEVNGKQVDFNTGTFDYHIFGIYPQEFTYATFEKERTDLYASNPTREQIDELKKRWRTYFTIDASHYAPDYMAFNSNGVFSDVEIEKITALHNDYIRVYTEGEDNDTMHIIIGGTDSPRTITIFIDYAQKNAYEIFRDYNIIYTGCLTLNLHQKGLKSE